MKYKTKIHVCFKAKHINRCGVADLFIYKWTIFFVYIIDTFSLFRLQRNTLIIVCQVNGHDFVIIFSVFTKRINSSYTQCCRIANWFIELRKVHELYFVH